MSKKVISKAMLGEMIARLETDGYAFSRESSNAEVNVFVKEAGSLRIVFTYTVSGRGNYSAFGTLTLIYKELSAILFGLLEDSPFAADYDLDDQGNLLAGVGIRSEVGKYAADNTTYYCASEAQAEEFALHFSRQVKSEEDNFVKPHMDLALTLKQFRKPMHASWPGPPRVFLEHLVGAGVKNKDPDMIGYAFQKAEEVCKKLVPQACPLEFMATLKQRVALLDFMTAAGRPGQA